MTEEEIKKLLKKYEGKTREEILAGDLGEAGEDAQAMIGYLGDVFKEAFGQLE